MDVTLLWFVAFAILLLLEVFTTGFVCIFFSIGALAACLVAWLGLGIAVQLSVFSLVAVGSLILLRQHMQKIFKGQSAKDGIPTSPLLHQQGVVVAAISPTVVGQISVGGSFWRATADAALPVDTVVRVVGTDANDGLILRVVKVDDTPLAA